MFNISKNPNREKYNEATAAVDMNNGYCPCELVRDDSTHCMCKNFRESEHSGFCHCERFYKVKEYPIITLCGSTRFKDEFIKAQKELTLDGNIVISVGLFGHADDEDLSEDVKDTLDDIHKAKIAMSDAIYVINPNGYIGKSTRSEILWANALNRVILSLEPIDIKALEEE